ncbi:MAG TPA: VTT domain-containing protein [Herpetosiphonaceae bacterium]
MRLLWLFLMLVALILIPFALWGDALESTFSTTGAVSWLTSYGHWAWVAGIMLLIADLFLPLPGTVIISALGYVYGPLLGGLIGAAGSFLSGVTAYVLCRFLGRRAAVWLLGQRELARSERLFADMGGWIVVLSRWLPVFPEAIACMAGLTRMPWSSFLLALICGSLPLGFVFAAVGHAGIDRPALALLLSAALPPILWLGARLLLHAQMEAVSRDDAQTP